MAKRKRKERRQRQKDNAIKRGDFGAIRALAQRNAEAGTKTLLTALQSHKADPADPEVLALAESLADPLRQKECHEMLLSLVACFPEPSTHLRLARALSAIHLGQDDHAAQDVAADPDVARFVRPLLTALQGKPTPRTPAKSPPSVRSIHALARAATAARGGSTTKARTALRSIDANWSRHFGVQEFQRILDMKSRRLHWVKAIGLTRITLSLPLVSTSVALRRAIALLLAPRFPAAVLGRMDQFCLPPEDVAAVSVQASSADAELDSEQARVSHLIVSVGAEAFDPEHRPVAHLFEAFAFLRSDPLRARVAFDKAVSAGADMAEALRGRAKAHECTGRSEDAVKSYVRLAKLLERDPGGVPVALASARLATSIAISTGGLRLAREALTLVQNLAGLAPWLDTAAQVDLLALEFGVWIHHDRQRAKAALAKADSIDAKHPAVWQARIDLARLEERGDDADAILFEAAKLHISDELVAEARKVRAARGQAWSPEAGASAGELAAELHARVLRADAPSIDDLLACRDQLPHGARVAFDMARFASLSLEGLNAESETALINAYYGPDVDPATRDAWLVLASESLYPENVIPMLVERARHNPADPILARCYRRIALQESKTANRLRGQLAPFLSHSELQCLASLRFGEEEVRQYLRPFDSALRPHYSLIAAVLDGDPPVAGLEQDDDDIEDLEMEETLDRILKTMGAPPGILERATPAQRAEAVAITMEIVTTTSPHKLLELAQRLRDVLEGSAPIDYRF